MFQVSSIPLTPFQPLGVNFTHCSVAGHNIFQDCDSCKWCGFVAQKSNFIL